MASALSRGSKVRVMTTAEWFAHPDRATVAGADGKTRVPILHDGRFATNVILSDAAKSL